MHIPGTKPVNVARYTSTKGVRYRSLVDSTEVSQRSVRDGPDSCRWFRPVGALIVDRFSTVCTLLTGTTNPVRPVTN